MFFYSRKPVLSLPFIWWNIFLMYRYDWHNCLKVTRWVMWLAEKVMIHHHTLLLISHFTTIERGCSLNIKNSRCSWICPHCSSYAHDTARQLIVINLNSFFFFFFYINALWNYCLETSFILYCISLAHCLFFVFLSDLAFTLKGLFVVLAPVFTLPNICSGELSMCLWCQFCLLHFM